MAWPVWCPIEVNVHFANWKWEICHVFSDGLFESK